jgi:membrane associated rhomboid family serine protease
MHEEISDHYSELAQPKRPFPWVTWSIFGTTVAVFLVQLGIAYLVRKDVVGEALAFSPQAMAEDRYWTLVTYAWVHAVSMFNYPGLFWLHIAANMIPLICLGQPLEELIGSWRFLVLYLGGAVSAVLAWYFFDAGSNEPIIGASGAIFALIAAVGTAAPRSRVVVYLIFVLPIHTTLRIMALTICGFEAVQFAFGWIPGIAHSAHLGGAVFGFLYMGLLRLTSRWWLFPD